MPEHQALKPTPFTVFNAETGDILRSGVCQAGSLSSQSTSTEEIVIEGEYSDGLFSLVFDEGGYSVVAKPSAPPTAHEVWREKDRRLALGFDYDFGDARGVHRIGTSPTDMAGWEEVTTLAQALINAGNAAGTILVLTDTGPAELTAAEWQQVLLAAAAFRQPLWLKSFEIAAMNPIPADYASDERWST